MGGLWEDSLALAKRYVFRLSCQNDSPPKDSVEPFNLTVRLGIVGGLPGENNAIVMEKVVSIPPIGMDVRRHAENRKH